MLIKLEINKKNIEKNIEKINNINKNIICVLKDDAYGLGIENILPILIENGYRYFAVAYIEEAGKIKRVLQEISEKRKKSEKNDILYNNQNTQNLEINKKYNDVHIMTLNYIEREDLTKALDNNIEITIFSLYQLRKYKSIFENWSVNLKKEKCNIEKKQKRLINIHIKVNTGMNRLGFDKSEIDELIYEIKNLQSNTILKENNVNVEIKSIFSHISHSEDKNSTEKQIKLYEDILKQFDSKGMKYEYKHIQASPLLFKFGNKYNYDFARVGMAIYGMEPLSEKVGLNQTIRLTSKIISIRKVAKGEHISYGSNGILTEDKTVAVVPIGYAHGLQKQIENNGAYVLINGEKAYLMGEVCMDMIIVDITNILSATVDDEVVIIGKSEYENKQTGEKKENEITLLQMAKWANTIQDDVLSKWYKGIKKVVTV